MAGRTLLPWLLAAALAGCGAAGPAPAPPLAAEVKQYRSDIAKRTVAVTVANRGERGVLVRRVALAAAGFPDDPSAEVMAEVPTGSQVDLRVPYGEVRCDAARPGRRADAALLAVQDADGAQHDVRLELASGGLLDRLHRRECADEALAAVADVRLSSQWSRDGDRLAGALVLERRSGTTPVTVVEAGGNVLFTVRPAQAGTPLGRLGASAAALELPLRITATRCDVHALADSKRSYVLSFYVSLGSAEPQLVTTTADTSLQRQLDQLVVDTCRPGS